jgi:hypothetical protein
MKFKSPANIYGTFSPLYKVLKLFGIITFQMNLTSGKVYVNARDIFYMIFWWGLLIMGIILNIKSGAREPGEQSEIIISAWHWLLIFQVFATFYVQIMNFLRRKNIEKLFNMIADFDEIVSIT